MKKYMFIIAAALFSLTVSAQRPEKKATPVTNDTKKSETTVQRTRTESTGTTTRSESSTRPTVTRSDSDNRGSDSRNESTSRTTVTRTSSDSPRTDNRSESSVRSAETRTSPDSPRTDSRNESVIRTTETRSASDNPRPESRSENTDRTSVQRTTTVSRETTVRTEEPVRSSEVRTTRTEDPNRNDHSVRADNDPEDTREFTRTRDNSEVRTENRTDANVVRTPTSSDVQPERRENSISGSRDNNSDRNVEERRRTYSTPHRTVVYREHPHVNRPHPIEYRKVHYPYRSPSRIHVIWTPRMYHEYMIMYPDYNYWYYPAGYRIHTISAYDAAFHIGEVRNVYGRVHDVWFSWETDEYFLYFGAPYPYQDFTVIVPGIKARHFSRRPEIFFEGRHLWVTGLISLYDGKPEIVVKRYSQIHLY